MSSIAIPSLSALVSATKLVLEVVGQQLELPIEKKRAWFEDHIAPSYEQLCSIHEDYTTQFSKALQLLDEQKSLKDVVEILKRERPNLLLNRQEIYENLIALRQYRMQKKRKPKFMIIFYDYVSSINVYLNSASPLPRSTWYSYFIDTFSRLVEAGEDPFEYDYPGISQGHDTINLAKEQLNLAINKNMPADLRKVQENYGKLRAECLSQI